jgi:transcriptional regulator with XRE-family HTH domain
MLSPEKRQRNQDTLGSLLKAARLRRGFTQKELADAVGLEYYTMISQLELGYISVPPALWVPLGVALRENIEEFVTICLLEIQPEVYTALFGDVPPSEVARSLSKLKEEHKLVKQK